MKKKFNHFGIPTKEIRQDEIHLPHLKMYVTDHERSPNGIQWMRFEEEFKNRPSLVLRLVEELRHRDATINEFFLAYSLRSWKRFLDEWRGHHL